MAASTRIKASNIVFKIGTTDYACDANIVELTLDDAPGDVQTFCEVRPGGEWKLNLEGVTSGDAASLYQVLWANFGTKVAFTIAPAGNAAPATGDPIGTDPEPALNGALIVAYTVVSVGP